MTMQSSDLLPALRELPGGESSENRSFRETITGIVNMDRAMYAAEFASAASFGMWGIFGHFNMDDALRENLTQAHESAFENYDGTLTQHWNEMVELGRSNMESFVEELRSEAAIKEAAVRLGYDTPIDNVDDRMFEAFREVFPLKAENFSLLEYYQDKIDLGEKSVTGLVSNIKGRIGEYIANDNLMANGYPDLKPAPSPTHPNWDSFSEESNTYFQSKVGYENNLGGLINEMEGSASAIRETNPDAEVFFPTTSETFEAMSQIRPDLADYMLDIIGSNAELDQHVRGSLDTLLMNEGLDIPDGLIDQITNNPDFMPVEGITDGLETLSDHLGIDIPDGVGEIIPYAGAIFATARLIANVLKTEKEFKVADRTTKNKIQVVQTLTLISRMGPKTVLSIAGGKGGAIGGGAIGTLVGTVVPGVGNAIGGTAGTICGGIAGIVTGYRIGNYLSKHLEPHILNLALNITRMTNDDLFYYKNKVRIDNVALSYQEQARALAAPT